ncbi:MAG: hypothetical protein OEM05_19110 [Myxococcales bacterium]|nr:hypothetical protein [Myxococcales bacterium]
MVADPTSDCREFTHSDQGLSLDEVGRVLQKYIVEHALPGFRIDKNAAAFETGSRATPIIVASVRPAIAIVPDSLGWRDLRGHPSANMAKAHALAFFTTTFPCPSSLAWFSPDLGTRPTEAVFSDDTATISWQGEELIIHRVAGTCSTSREERG